MIVLISKENLSPRANLNTQNAVVCPPNRHTRHLYQLQNTYTCVYTPTQTTQTLGHLRDSHWFFSLQPLDSRSKGGNQQNNCSFPARLYSSVIERKCCRQTGKQTYTDRPGDTDTDLQTNRQMRRIIVNFPLWSWQVDRHCGAWIVNFFCSSRLKKQIYRKIMEMIGMPLLVSCRRWSHAL